jgi:low temperature requirement protein LtrA
VRPPRLRTTDAEEGERRATWLELFFDLVFVVAIAQLSHELVEDHSLAGFARYGFGIESQASTPPPSRLAACAEPA